MNITKVKSIASGTMKGLTLLVSVVQIADFASSMVNKYRKPKKVAGFKSATED